MAHLLFVDESGQDHRESPYEVLAGVAVEDRDLWNLVRAIQDAETDYFGTRYSAGHGELKSKKLLGKKTFRKATQLAEFEPEHRRLLAKACIECGETAGRPEITALAQAKLAYVTEVLDLCARHHCKVIASMITNSGCGALPEDMLRRDYCYMFERFFYYLEDRSPDTMGIMVFDELEKSRSHLLVQQMDRYFKYTAKGRNRASQVIPEPFFVHSDLTTGIQLADIAAYVLSWGFRSAKGLDKPARGELAPYVEQVRRMRFSVVRDIGPEMKNKRILSFSIIPELGADEADKEEKAMQ